MKKTMIVLIKIIVGILLAFYYLKLMFVYKLIELRLGLFGPGYEESLWLVPFAFVIFPTALLFISSKNWRKRFVGASLILLIILITGIEFYNEKIEIEEKYSTLHIPFANNNMHQKGKIA